MKIPTSPPDINSVIREKLVADPRWLSLVLAHSNIVDDEGLYLHWEDFRFKPTPEGFSAEEWWAVTRTARYTAGRAVPFHDRDGETFGFCEPPALNAILHELDMNAGGSLGTDAAGLSAGEGQAFLVRSLAEEPFASSLIEGAATTRQIAKKMIFDNRPPRTRDERMVLNNYRAMEFVKAHKADSWSMPLLLELHRIVTEGTMDDPNDAGRLRTDDDIRVVDDTSGEFQHQPPPAAALRDRLEAVIRFANEAPGANHWLHPLVKAFILHFMLSYEHPFVDGSGRVARAMFYWAALKAGYRLTEYLSISSAIAESRIAYGKTFLEVETDGADLTYFLVYHARILKLAIERLTTYVARKRAEVAKVEKALSSGTFNARQSWLINEFVRRRMARITISGYLAHYPVSYITARTDLERLVAAGLCKKSKSGKESLYRPAAGLEKRLTETV